MDISILFRIPDSQPPETIDSVLRPMSREPSIRNELRKGKKTHYDNGDLDR